MSKDQFDRVAEHPVDEVFLRRWSPRSFLADPVQPEQLATLFEAARWAPSCFNEQPWLFMYAATPKDLAIYRQIIVPQNRIWADKAPVLALAFARRNFARNGKVNKHYAFDTGAAWMSLALQAHKLGLAAHAMGGFFEEQAYLLLGVPKEKYEAMAAIAIGRRGPVESLPAEFAAREAPGPRKALAEVAIEGLFQDQHA
ncbi:MAG: nitroreductase family protein [Phycisphaerales bacterium]|nr:nitroreductase family protein [Phycisphaerales bacterium]